MREVPLTFDEPAAPPSPTASAADGTRLRAAVDAHFVFVGRSLRGLGVPEADVDDALQQVFLVLSRRLGEMSDSGVRSFLFQTALRIASRARRTVSRRREVDEDSVPEPLDTVDGPEELTEQRRAREMLDGVLDGMEMDLRSVFVLFEIEELSTVEIAALLELPAGTVASRLRRAREEFQARVKRVSLQNPSGGGR